MDGEGLKHDWMGVIGDPKVRQERLTDVLRKAMKVGVVVLLGGVASTVGAHLSGSTVLWVLAFNLVLIGLIIVLSILYIWKGRRSDGFNEYLEGPERKRWLDDGLLESKILDELYLHKFEYERARAAGYHLHLKLANGLRIYVATVSFGHGVTVQLRIDGISEVNAEEAKRLQRALDEIPITSGGP